MAYKRIYSDKYSESDTENIFRDFYGSKTFIEKASINDEYGFKSKHNTSNKGFPDFFLDRKEKNYCIIVEAKNVEKNNLKALRECKFYMLNNNIKGKDLIGIAISLNLQKELLVNYLIKKDGKDIVELPIKKLISLEELDVEYNKLYLKTSYEKMVGKIDTINTFFQNYTNINVNNRPLMFSALIIAIKDKNFLYEHITDNKIINDNIYRAVFRKLANKTGNMNKFDATLSFAFIKDIDIGCSIEKYKEFLSEFKDNFLEFYETTKYYDVIGTAYTKFLKYVQKEGGQDVVLTPDHIKSLMFKIAGITKDDVILDTCTGSAGFLATGFGFLLDKNREAGENVEVNSVKYKHISEKQLIGIEFLPNIYALAFSNMILHGDGRSNLYLGDSLSNFDVREINPNESDCEEKKIEDVIRELKPTFGIINPPYGDNQAIVFINRTLDLLENKGKLIVICPSNTFKNNFQDLTHSILRKATLEAVIDLTNCFAGQKIGTKPSIFVLKKEPHDTNKDIYFYDFTDDGFRYSIRGDKNISFEEKESLLLERYNKKEIIKGVSYWKKYDNRLENLQFVKEIDNNITRNDFINTLLDYYIYEINEARNVK